MRADPHGSTWIFSKLNADNNFENRIRGVLKKIGFTTLGYYPYPERVDIIGYWYPHAPFRSPFKILATIVKGELNTEIIENSYKLSEASRTAKQLIFAQTNKEKISGSLLKLIESSEAEYFDTKAIDEISPPSDKKDALTDLEKVSTPYLIEYLPEFARQQIPFVIGNLIEGKIPAWKFFEQAVFSIFNFSFMYMTNMLGSKTLFENEPEGEVVTSQRFGLLYECKSSSDSYNMTSGHQATYEGYIEEKKSKFSNVHNVDLQYFVVVSPKFSGDIKYRRDEIFDRTKVLVIFLEADLLKDIACWVSKMDNNLKKQVDLRKIFKVSDSKVERKTVQDYIQKFDATYKERY